MGTRVAFTRQRRACLAVAATSTWGIGALTSRMDHQLFVLLIVVIYSITDLGEAHRYAAALSGLDGLRLGSDHITVLFRPSAFGSHFGNKIRRPFGRAR